MPVSGAQVLGAVQALDAARQTFRINSLAVDSRTKLHLHGPLGLDVAVKVTGTFDVNGVLVGSKVQGSK